MKISTRIRYAVVAMVDIAMYSSFGSVSIAQISERNKISVPYLEQLFVDLKRAGLVASYKGIKGGYVLTKDSSKITVYDIFKAMNDDMSFVRCSADSLGCVSTKGAKCVTHDLWAGLMDNVSEYLQSLSLDKVVFNHCQNNIIVNFLEKENAEYSKK